MNPDMDMERILRPASLSITLDNDIIRQVGHTQRQQSHTPGHLVEQYALELKEWTHPTGPDTMPKLLTAEMDKIKLQEERICLQMMARNIREERTDAIRLLCAQEETLAAQERQETETGNIQRRDTIRDPALGDIRYIDHQKKLRRIHNETEHPPAEEDESSPANGPSDHLEMGCHHETSLTDTLDMDDRVQPSSPRTCSTPR